MQKILNMNVTTKIALASLLMTAVLVLASYTGYNATSRLSGSLDFVAGPAWDTADGAMEGVITIQQQMILTREVIANARQGKVMDVKEMESIVAETDTALGRMVDAHQLPDKIIDEFTPVYEKFKQSRANAITAAYNYVAAYKAMKTNSMNFVELMGYIEDVGDAAVENLEKNPDKKFTWKDISDNWTAADGAMESRIALLTRLNQYQQFIDHIIDYQTAETQLGQTLVELKDKVGEIIKLPDFNKTILDGTFKGRRYPDALTELVAQHEQTFSAALIKYKDFVESVSQFDGLSHKLLEKLDAVEEMADGTVEGEMGHIESAISTSYTLITTSLIIGVIISVLTVVFSIRFIAKPLAEVARSLHDISEGEGNLNVSLKVNTKDEIGEIATGFNKFVEKIRGAIILVTESTVKLSSSAQQMNSVTRETTANVSTQQSETEQVATAMNEMTSTVAEVASHASLAAESANRANQHATDGRRIVQETVKVIHNLADEVKSASDVILNVEKDSEQIGGVLDVIKGIAEQTNLLALNAAIEAARAGEQGRGFAVVADEVRTLASRTQESTQEIQAMIERLQESSKNAVSVMQSGRNMAESGVEFISKAGESLDQITASVADINDMNTQIASAAEEQNAVAEEINRNICTISQISQSTVEEAQRMAQSSEELSNISGELEHLVGQFKT